MKRRDRLSVAVAAIILLLSCETPQQKAEKARQAKVALQQARDAKEKDEQRKKEEAERRAQEAEAARTKRILGDALWCQTNEAINKHQAENAIPVLNESIERPRGFINRETGTLTILFDYNNAWVKPRGWRLRVWLYDRNGEYLYDFITKDRFVSTDTFTQEGIRELGWVELKYTDNILQYQINLRDAAFVSAMQISWHA